MRFKVEVDTISAASGESRDRPDEGHDHGGGYFVPTWVGSKILHTVGSQRSGKLTQEVTFPDELCGLYSARFSPDGETFAAAFGAGALQVYTSDGYVEHNLIQQSDDAQPMTCTRYHPRNQYVVYSCDFEGRIHVCKLQKGRVEIFAKEPKNQINSFDMDYSARYLVSGGKDGILRMYSLETGKLLHKYQRPKDSESDDQKSRYHTQRIFAVKFHEGESWTCLSGGWDNCIKIWDVRTKRGCQHSIEGPQVYGDAIDTRESTVLTGSWKVSESLQIWELRTCTLLETVVAMNRRPSINGEFVWCAKYFDNVGEVVMSGTSGVDAVELISIPEKKVLCSLHTEGVVYAIDNYEDKMIFGGIRPTIHIADYME